MYRGLFGKSNGKTARRTRRRRRTNDTILDPKEIGQWGLIWLGRGARVNMAMKI